MVDFWGKNRATLYAAEENATLARYNRDVVTLTTIVTVANTYFQVLAAQDELRVARRNLAAAERILDAHQTAVRRRNRVATRPVAAGSAGGDRARHDSPA